jgi:hypothetical protein
MQSQCMPNKHVKIPIHTSNSYIRTSIYEPNNPSILLTRSRRLTHRARIWDAQGLTKSQISPIRSRLVPALDSSCDGVEDDGKVECPR